MSINTAVCLSVCFLFVCLSQISSQICSQVSTQPLLRPAWRLLLISCSIRTTGQVHNMRRVYRGWIKQPCKCSKQSACSPEPQYVPDIPVFLSIYLFTPACPVRASYLLLYIIIIYIFIRHINNEYN